MKILAEEGTVRWEELHNSPLITGSRAATIMGYGFKEQTPFTTWAEMTGRAEPQSFDYEGIVWGHDLEDGVAKRWQRERDKSGGKKLTLLPSPGMVGHPELDFLAGTPDRMIAEVDGIGAVLDPDGVYEGKCTEVWNKAQWADGPPLKAMIQAQFYIDLCELDWCSVCGFLGISEPPAIKDTPRDQGFIDKMREFLTEWHERHIVGDEQPDPGPSRRDGTIIRDMHGPENTGKVIFLPQPMDDLGDQIKELRATKSAVEAELKPLENKFKIDMGDAQVAHGATWTWKLAYIEADVKAHTRKSLRLTPSARKR